MASKYSHHLIKLLMLIDISIQQSTSLQRYHRLTTLLIVWLIETLSYWKMVRRICEITVTLDFIFRLVHCSSEDVSFNSIYLNVLEGVKQFYMLMLSKKTRLETPFKGANLTSMSKNVKLWKLGPLFLWESSENCSICYAFLVFSDQTIVWKWFRLPPMIKNSHVTR